MSSQVAVNASGGPITTSVRILLQHVGNTAVDLWLDSDHNGRPDKWFKRLRDPADHDDEPVVVGEPKSVRDKVVQWIWQPSQPSGSAEGWKVSIDLRQDDKSLPGFPRVLSGQYPAEKWGLFQTWVKLV